jgi:hypothetical protein
MKANIVIYLLAIVLFAVHAPDASAVTIVATNTGGQAPPNAVGGGDLDSIFNAAAKKWEMAYGDDFVLHLYYGWAPTGSAGTHTLLEIGDDPAREIVGTIMFDNSGAVSFYLDPTPHSDEEYGRFTEEFQDLGGGFVNVARVFSGPRGIAQGRCDLFSVALHEIGHSLGIGVSHPGFLRQGSNGTIKLARSRPYAGTVIPLASNNSGVTSHFDATQVAYGSLMTGVGAEERRLPSALDILVNAQISGFQILDLNPRRSPGPEPLTPEPQAGRNFRR